MIIISLHCLLIVKSHIKKPINLLIGYLFYICGRRVLILPGFSYCPGSHTARPMDRLLKIDLLKPGMTAPEKHAGEKMAAAKKKKVRRSFTAI